MASTPWAETPKMLACRPARSYPLRPGGEVIELARVGHHPQVEVPDEFARGALRLLDASR